jgi:hypothetical protein
VSLLLGLLGSVVVVVAGPWGLLGVPLLVVAWWRLRAASVRAVLAAAGLWSVPLLVAPPLFSRDAYAYAAQAHLVVRGLDPYTHGPADAAGPLSAEVDPVWLHTRSPYGPVFLRLAALVQPGEHPYAAVLLLRLLAVVGVALLAWGVLRLGGSVWLAVANPLVLLHAVGGAHNDALMAGLLVAGVALAPVSLAAAAALVTIGALVKLPAVIGLAFLPFLGRAPRVRAVLVVGGSAAATALLLTLVSGLGWGWVHTLNAGEARRSLLSVSTGLGVLIRSVPVGHAVGLALAAGCCAWLLWRDRSVRGLGLALLAVAVLGPVVQPWYLLWGLPLLAVAAGPRLRTGLAVASAVTCLLVLPTGRHVIRPPLYGVPAVLVAAVAYAAARSASTSRTEVST